MQLGSPLTWTKPSDWLFFSYLIQLGSFQRPGRHDVGCYSRYELTASKTVSRGWTSFSYMVSAMRTSRESAVLVCVVDNGNKGESVHLHICPVCSILKLTIDTNVKTLRSRALLGSIL